MGNCFSDPTANKSGRTLGSAPRPSQPTTTNTTNTNTANANTNNSAAGARTAAPPRTLGGPGADGGGEARDNALRAAEERAKAAQTKGVHSANPKSGQLSKKLAEERRTPSGTQAEERLMDRGQWN